MPLETNLDATTQLNVQRWLEGHYDEATKQEIRALMRDHPKELQDAFYTNLAFGTAGMRGIMGVGSNRMNRYTVGAATQALANYIHTQPAPLSEPAVLIGYDSRHHSKEFAEESAKILAANDIRAYLFKDIRPTPLVSFGCRYKKCNAAIMITASHNPPEYNGYKVYWSDGGQVLPPHDTGIMKQFNAITDITQIKKVPSLDHPLITLIGTEIDTAYLKTIAALPCYPKEDQQDGHTLKVVYTSLHGTGITLMPQALKEWGFTSVAYVDKQIIPDGDFPTAHHPNPEERKALELGIQKLKEVQGDLLIATDPDADRVGLAYRDQTGIQLLNGNQIAAVCLHHICEALSAQKALPKNAGFIKSIVTTELFQAIVDSYHAHCFNVLTGFKYIAEKIRDWERDPHGYKYIFGGEESYGYLYGTQTRDKDAILMGVLLCEVTLHAKRQGKSLGDLLNALFMKYGVYIEKVLSLNFEESKEGKEKMTQAMDRLRKSPPKAFNGISVRSYEDYARQVITDVKSGQTKPLHLEKSDVLLFWLEDNSKVIIRPSGTEPKIKLYCGVHQKQFQKLPEAIATCTQRAETLLAALKNDLTTL